MEPIGHEGLGRLLKLEGDLQTPHVVFSHSDLEESKFINDRFYSESKAKNLIQRGSSINKIRSYFTSIFVSCSNTIKPRVISFKWVALKSI